MAFIEVERKRFLKVFTASTQGMFWYDIWDFLISSFADVDTDGYTSALERPVEL